VTTHDVGAAGLETAIEAPVATMAALAEAVARYFRRNICALTLRRAGVA